MASESASWRPGAHPCKRAYDALKSAGHSPEVVRTCGFAALPDVTRGRKEVKRLTGESGALCSGSGQRFLILKRFLLA